MSSRDISTGFAALLAADLVPAGAAATASAVVSVNTLKNTHIHMQSSGQCRHIKEATNIRKKVGLLFIIQV